LMEVNDRWLAELAELRQSHPHFLLDPQEDNFGIALFSRQPLRDPQLIHLASAGVNAVAATVEFGTNHVFLLGVHTLPPASREYAIGRNEQLAEAASLIRRRGGPAILLGDLNTSPWSPYYRKLIVDSKLKNTAQGRGISASWPTRVPPLFIPLDYVLVSEGIAVGKRFLGPNVGSDHFPVVAELAFE
jgi:endonuclease/exonuclease/phosphatase (EEP) superfamily protein YafD